jgi:hypothetical protein
VFDKQNGQAIMTTMLLPNKLAAVVTLVAIGLFASLGLTWPVRDVQLFRLSFTLSGRMLLGVILVGIAWTGTDWVLAQHPKVHPKGLGWTGLHTVLPAAMTVAAWALLPQPDSIQAKAVGAVGACALLALLILSEYYVLGSTGRGRVILQSALRLMAYWVATLLYIAIRLGTSFELAAVVAIATGTAVLVPKLLGDSEPTLQLSPSPGLTDHGLIARLLGHGTLLKLATNRWIVALGLGALLGATSWLLGHWVASPFLHSLVLVVLLYSLVGLVRHFWLGALTRQVLLEYLLVGTLVLLLLLSRVR